MEKPTTYFHILRTCARYDNLDYNARHEFIKLDPPGRNGNVLLNAKDKFGRKTDLSFYPNEVEQIMNLKTEQGL